MMRVIPVQIPPREREMTQNERSAVEKAQYDPEIEADARHENSRALLTDLPDLAVKSNDHVGKPRLSGD